MSASDSPRPNQEKYQASKVAATKSTVTDVVTAVDRESEQLIRKRVLQARTDDSFLGEEGDDYLTGDEGADVCVSSWNRMAPNTLPALAKAGGNYLNSQLIRMEADSNGFSEGIALDVRGHVQPRWRAQLGRPAQRVPGFARPQTSGDERKHDPKLTNHRLVRHPLDWT